MSVLAAGVRSRSEFRVCADRTGSFPPEAELRTHYDPGNRLTMDGWPVPVYNASQQWPYEKHEPTNGNG